ncbi:MAG: MFS transporter [Candidatus Cloacimonetes bacterium]|nr:MFS transporter [Candidatus Cloacimonadota bacterium]
MSRLKIERHTARLLLWSALFNGVVLSLNQTQDIIARKALLAKDWQLMLITMIWPLANLCSIWWGRIFERSCHKSRYFLLAGVLGRLSLVYAIWLSTMNEYLVVLTLMYAFNSLLVPAQNTIYQKNIDLTRRAKVYGITISVGMAVSIGVSFLAGRLLDLNESYFRWLLAGTGICGFISTTLLYKIRIQDGEPCAEREPAALKDQILDPVRRMLKVLKENKDFAKFERSFSIYGMGFIVMTPIIPIYLVNYLKLSYTANFLAKGILSQVGMLLLSPYLGRLHDRYHPFRFISIAFATLVLFPALIILSSMFMQISYLAVALVFIAYLMYGIAMSAVNIAWNMGSIYFAGKEDAAMYQSVHVTMTGIRGLIAPVLGFVLMRLIGIMAVFGAAAFFLILASLISYRDYRHLKLRKLST